MACTVWPRHRRHKSGQQSSNTVSRASIVCRRDKTKARMQHQALKARSFPKDWGLHSRACHQGILLGLAGVIWLSCAHREVDCLALHSNCIRRLYQSRANTASLKATRPAGEPLHLLMAQATIEHPHASM